MKKQTFRKLAITFSAVCLGTFLIIFACTESEYGWFHYSNFTPKAFLDKSYSPLIFDAIGNDDNYNNRFTNENIDEWNTYLEGKEERKITYSEFLNYANQVDVCAMRDVNYQYWEYGNESHKKYTSNTLWNSLLHKYETTKDPFLKNRYWFQTIKAGFYSKKQSNAISFFEKTEKTAPKNTLYYRAASYIAGIHYAKKDYSTANYLYSIAFDHCPALRMVVAYSFQPQEEKDWNQSLAMATNNKEKAALWAVLGYHTDALRSISEITKLDPESPHLDFLVTRLINQNEFKNAGLFWEEEEKPVSIANYKKNLSTKIDSGAVEKISQLADEGKVKNKFLFNIAAGYLNCLHGDYKIAENYYTKAEKISSQNKLAKDQLRLLRFVNTLSSMETINEKNEILLLQDLKWLFVELTPPKIIFDQRTGKITYSKDTTGYQASFRIEQATNWSKHYLSLLFEAKGDKVFSELFNPSKKFYRTAENTESMKNLMLKKNKTEFEQFALKIYYVSLSDIYEYQSVLLTFQDKLEDAIKHMDLAEYNKHQILLANPFNGKIKDCHDCEFNEIQKTRVTLYDFLLKMKEMESKISNNKDVYNNSLLLGNAFYNISYFGNARAFYDGRIINESHSSTWDMDSVNYKIFTDCTLAIKYYQKAFDNATNKEQKAKCTYMLTKCERNDYYNTHIYNLPDDYGNYNKAGNFVSWEGFKKLKADYSDTKYYKEVIEECGYFRRFLGKK